MVEWCAVLSVVLVVVSRGVGLDEEYLANYLANEYEYNATQLCNQYVLASWKYNTDLTGEGNAAAVNDQNLVYSNFRKDQWKLYFQGENWTNISNKTLERQLKFLTVLGSSALNDSRLSELNNITTKMEGIYSTAKICPFTKQNCDLQKEGLSLDPEIEEILATSTNYEELQYTWKAWRDATGPYMRDDYKKYVEINNEAAKLNGMNDYGDLWRDSYESSTFVSDIDKLWQQVEPLYTELHTYVLYKLRDMYGDKLGDDGLIPAHILGNMWAQSWRNIYDLLKPYPNGTTVDVTSALKNSNFSARQVFVMSDEFYQSLGLPANNMSYDESLAMIEKPKDGRSVVCHASAWDFCDGEDFRIKMCTNINMKDFITVHHEMGHIQYYIQYKDKPITFRTGANPGFHEAVGDTMALSVATPKHLKKIGLLGIDYQDSEENDINSLMQMALDKVAFLPFGLLIDKWRWDVFSGNISQQQWNTHWWKLREQFQKVKAPVPRSEQDFDPGAKYHIPGDSQYIAYFVAHILQFQMHKALCIAAGEYDPSDASKPLYKCDIYNSLAAGEKLSAGLSLGASKHWSEALQAMTGQSSIDGSAILEYFQPLQEFLQRSNAAKSSEESSQVVPIVVGVVLAVLVLIVIICYLVIRHRKSRQQREQRSSEDTIAVQEIKAIAEDKDMPKAEPEATKAEDK